MIVEHIRPIVAFCVTFTFILISVACKFQYRGSLSSVMYPPTPWYHSLFERYNLTNLDMLKPLKTPRPYFKFSLVPNITKDVPKCMEGQKIKWSMIVAIKTHWNRFSQRRAIRNSWGGIRMLNGVRIYVIYIVGQPESSKDIDSLAMESTKYRDLLQVELKETYRSVGFKAMAAMQWVGDCLSDDWIYFSADDDVIPNLETLFSKMKYLFNRAARNANMLDSLPMHCALRFIRRPHVNREGKWAVNITEYPHKRYPSSCLGGFYGLSVKLTKAIYNASRYYPYFIHDDVYLTGFMRLVVCDSFQNEFKFAKLDPLCGISKLPSSNFQHVHVKPAEYKKLWYENEKWLRVDRAKICRRRIT